MCGSVFPLSGKPVCRFFYNCLTSLCRIKTHPSQWENSFSPACGFISVGCGTHFGVCRDTFRWEGFLRA
ncbi:hypothetical protein IX321_002467 [Bacteroides pyogenes]|nr:hypothetical protein [Bacteroides pyogenes]MBR8718524.1 hypothetical protein [Bacteroides pyogenes]MBR8748002.1 hypothetical protein [Bacteroides pyogenes]MBR8758294.1 hypothetical protein [Bacteroides pyogenes]MBR8781519.1 hypothetical protein [Bacteroides pyogenes]